MTSKGRRLLNAALWVLAVWLAAMPGIMVAFLCR